MVQKVKITRLDVSTGKSQKIVDYIAEEKPFYLNIKLLAWIAIPPLTMILSSLSVSSVEPLIDIFIIIA